MQRGYDEIIATYDKETMEEIANHGCSSGVCFKHIYYDNTIGLFNKYPDEITSYLVDNFGTDFLVNIFTDNNCILDHYINDVVWCYIECIAEQIVNEYESTTCEELSLSYA